MPLGGNGLRSWFLAENKIVYVLEKDIVWINTVLGIRSILQAELKNPSLSRWLTRGTEPGRCSSDVRLCIMVISSLCSSLSGIDVLFPARSVVSQAAQTSPLLLTFVHILYVHRPDSQTFACTELITDVLR